jgi:hypothetical protein
MYRCAAPNISEEQGDFTSKGQAVYSWTTWPLKTEAPRSPTMLAATHPMTQCHIPEEQNPRQCCHKNAKSRNQ